MSKTMHIIARIPPGDLKENHRLMPVRGRMVTRPAYRDAMRQIVMTAISKARAAKWKSVPKASKVSVTVRVFWKTNAGDACACTKAVCDALQKAGIVEDDFSCNPVTSSRHTDKSDPRIEIDVEYLG